MYWSSKAISRVVASRLKRLLSILRTKWLQSKCLLGIKMTKIHLLSTLCLLIHSTKSFSKSSITWSSPQSKTSPKKSDKCLADWALIPKPSTNLSMINSKSTNMRKSLSTSTTTSNSLIKTTIASPTFSTTFKPTPLMPTPQSPDFKSICWIREHRSSMVSRTTKTTTLWRC